MKKSGTQIPSLRPLSTFSPCRMRDGRRGSVTTAWPSAASVGARMTARRSASGQVSEPSRTSAGAEARDERQRQPDAEQPRRDRDLVPQRAEVDPRGVAEEDERQRRLGEQLDGLARAAGSTRPRASAPTSSPIAVNTIGAGDRRPVEARRDRGEREQGERDRRQGPVHALTLLREPSGVCRGRGAARSSRSSRRPCRSKRSSRPAPSRVPPSGSVHVPENPVSSSDGQRALAGRAAREPQLQRTVGDPAVAAVSRSILNAAARLRPCR